MRLWVMSDLHVDSTMYELPPPPKELDALVIAGDVADGHAAAANWLREQAVPHGLPVVFVPGNHDYFGHDLHDDGLEHYEAAGVELLHPGRPTVRIRDTRFVGLSLWTDYRIAGDQSAAWAWARQSMPDIMAIDVGLRRATPQDFLELHRRHRAVLERELAEPFAGATVVLTQHAPHPYSLRSRLQLDPSDGSFASDMRDLMVRYEPVAWIHGHTHHNRDFYHEATRVVCNPRGPVLPGDRHRRRIENVEFQPGLVIEF